MVNIKRRLRMLYGGTIFLLIPLLVIPLLLSGEDAYGKSEVKSGENTDFDLTVKDELISLTAKDSSLRKIIEEIGDAMKIEVVGNIPEEEMISVEFNNLSLKNTLEKLSTNYGYLMDSEKEEKKITKIIILPKGEKTASTGLHTGESDIQEEKSNDPGQSEPFKFEFDPREYIDKE